MRSLSRDSLRVFGWPCQWQETMRQPPRPSRLCSVGPVKGSNIGHAVYVFVLAKLLTDGITLRYKDGLHYFCLVVHFRSWRFAQAFISSRPTDGTSNEPSG